MKIDPVLGTEADFKLLVDTLHQHDMRLILDGVFSHVGRNSKYFDFDGKSGGQGAYQTTQSPYFDWFIFNQYPDDYKSWWGLKIYQPSINRKRVFSVISMVKAIAYSVNGMVWGLTAGA
jgi:glycosidase